MNTDTAKYAQKSRELIKKTGDPYIQRPNRFRTLHKQTDIKQKKPQPHKNPSIQSSYGNIIINISENQISRSLKSRAGNNYGSLDIDFDNQHHRLSLKHRRSLDCDKFKAIGESRLIKAKSNLKTKQQESRELFRKPRVESNMKQCVNRFIMNFQSVLDTPIDLQTFQPNNPVVDKCRSAGARILGIVVRRRVRGCFQRICS